MKSFKMLMVITLILIFSIYSPEKYPEMKVEYIYGEYALDVNSPFEVVGFSDYVFIARIDEKIGTHYEYSDLSTRFHVYERTAQAYTQYSIRVMDNIKGNLISSESITLNQFGGISLDRKTIELIEEDVFLEKDAFYIIMASSSIDGELMLFSPHGFEKLSIDHENQIKDTPQYLKYMNYFKNEVSVNRIRFESKYVKNQ